MSAETDFYKWQLNLNQCDASIITKRLQAITTNFSRNSNISIQYKTTQIELLYDTACHVCQRLASPHQGMCSLYKLYQSYKPVQVSYKPVSYKPVSYKPVYYKPISYKPVSYKPVSYKPVSYKPVSYRPVSYKPVSYKPVSYKHIY